MIELSRGRFSRGKKTATVHRCPCLLVIIVTVAVDEIVNRISSTLQRKIFLLDTKVYEQFSRNSQYNEF